MQKFAYERPRTVPEAIRAMARASGASPRFLGGGTTLVDLMKLNVETPDLLIDITGIPELKTYDVAGAKELTFGSLVHMSTVADDAFIRAHYPALSEALWRAASQQLRNMATLGGNLMQRTRCAYFRAPEYPCNKRVAGSGCSAIDGNNRGHALLGGSDACIAVYHGDFAVALAALDASIVVAGPNGKRAIPIANFFLTPGATPQLETTVAKNEMIVQIRVPTTRAGKASTYQKIRDRESYAFALTSAAVALELSGNTVKDARIALGGVATKPWRAHAAERSLIGAPLTEAAAQHAGQLAFADARTTSQNAFRVPLGMQTVVESLLIAQRRA
jgi:xanthine dehydrogenase YagS FAD-binding subunit